MLDEGGEEEGDEREAQTEGWHHLGHRAMTVLSTTHITNHQSLHHAPTASTDAATADAAAAN